MIVLGLQMLKLVPALARFLPTLPQALRAHASTTSPSAKPKAAHSCSGAATFFLPCGFTQALQLYVLAKGSFTIGALTMLAFALGTLAGAAVALRVSSFAKGSISEALPQVCRRGGDRAGHCSISNTGSS